MLSFGLRTRRRRGERAAYALQLGAHVPAETFELFALHQPELPWNLAQGEKDPTHTPGDAHLIHIKKPYGLQRQPRPG